LLQKNDELIAATLDRNPAISESLADAAAPIAVRNSLAPVYSPWYLIQIVDCFSFCY
jgi:hypothetical protein